MQLINTSPKKVSFLMGKKKILIMAVKKGQSNHARIYTRDVNERNKKLPLYSLEPNPTQPSIDLIGHSYRQTKIILRVPIKK